MNEAHYTPGNEHGGLTVEPHILQYIDYNARKAGRHVTVDDGTQGQGHGSFLASGIWVHRFGVLMYREGANILQRFQERVAPWFYKCFSVEVCEDKKQRNHRFLEEALELVQACDCTAEEAHMLVDYVFNRPVGKKEQEVGGVMVTLAALCIVQGVDLYGEAEAELKRINTPEMIKRIRAKQATKPYNSPLPGSA